MYRRTSDRARPYQVAPQPVFPERHCDRLHVEDGGVERWREAAWRGHAEIFWSYSTVMQKLYDVII